MPFTSNLWKDTRTRALALCLLGAVVVTALGLAHLGQTLENRVLDYLYNLRPAAPPPDILIVGIDEASFQELRRAWPWPRRWHGELIRRLAAAGARLIVFDIGFADPSNPEDDRLFAAAIREAQNVILAQTFEFTDDPAFSRRILVQPLPPFRQAARGVGLSMVTPDADGIIRHFRLRLAGRDTLPAAAVRSLKTPSALPSNLAGLIHYAGPPRQISTVSYYQVLDKDRPLPAAKVRNRIVFIGRTPGVSIIPQGQADTFYTPFFGETGGIMSGVEVQANIFHTLMQRNWGRELAPAPRWGLLLLLLLLLGYPLARLSPLTGLGLLASLLILIGATSVLMFLLADWWLPPVLLGLGLAAVYSGNVLAHYVTEAREKRWLRQAFSRYVSPELVGDIITHPERLELGGEEVEVTVLFADLAGFTSLSETMAPRSLIGLLNDYFTPMTRIILDQQGTLDKFIGDAIMALWGAPVVMDNHAEMACRAALAMQAAMRELQEEWRRRGLPALQARIGVHSGPVVAGNVGSQERFNYTVLGDTVNLASRLEGVNKQYGTEILLSESTQRRVAAWFFLRELDKVQVKGRLEPVTVYELLGEKAGAPPEWLELFAAGRAAYLARQWDQATGLFQRVLELKGADGPAELYLRHCRDYREHPPPPHWQGLLALGKG